MTTFNGFSEEDLKRIKSSETLQDKDRQTRLNTNEINNTPTSIKFKRLNQSQLGLQSKLKSIKQDETTTKNEHNEKKENKELTIDNVKTNDVETVKAETKKNNFENDSIVNGSNVPPDVGVNDAEDEMASHKAKLEELQLKQKLMEEQNKKRKEMLSKALADRTRQTEEEVMKLEKIKKELQVLDGQFSQEVAVLRKKIDAACLTYSEAEKHYLKVEKEFLQAKIQLQKEKEKKELLTEHLCALITHNETRKAQKLDTLMLELANDKKLDVPEPKLDVKGDNPVIIDGVDQRTGKMVEFNEPS